MSLGTVRTFGFMTVLLTGSLMASGAHAQDSAEGSAESTKGAVDADAGASATGASATGASATGASATEGESPAVDSEEKSSDATAPVSGTETAEAPAAETPSVNLQTAEQEYDIRVRGLEGRINDLKEQIFRSKAKLTLLTEQVTGGLGTGAGLTVIHRNEMSRKFLLIEAHYFLDGTPLWQEVDESGERLTEMREHPVWDGNIVEGSHTLTVNLIYRGNGSGLFSYLSGYVFELKDSYNFSAEAGKVITIYASGWEKGNFTTELVDRPDIKFEPKITNQEAPVGQGQ